MGCPLKRRLHRRLVVEGKVSGAAGCVDVPSRRFERRGDPLRGIAKAKISSWVIACLLASGFGHERT